MRALLQTEGFFLFVVLVQFVILYPNHMNEELIIWNLYYKTSLPPSLI